MRELIDSEYGFSSMWRHIKIGAVLSFFLICGIGIFCLTAKISDAVIAVGKVELTSDLKKVSHLTGGVIAEVFVRDGQEVKQGDPLVRLDETNALANLKKVEKSLLELEGSQTRLLAERDDLKEIVFPSFLMEKVSDPVVADIIEIEKKLFDQRSKRRDDKKSQLKGRITQLEQEEVGFEAQIKSLDSQILLMQQKIRAARKLWEKQIVSLEKLNSFEQEAARLEEDKGKFVANLDQTRGKVSEEQAAILNMDRDSNSEIILELQEVEKKIAELQERRVSAQYELDHIQIEAPQDGFVQNLAMKTVGSVISPSDVIMEILTQKDNLIVTALIRQIDRDLINTGADVRLRFGAFDQPSIPELNGKLVVVSEDITTEEKTGIRYYRGRVMLNEEDMKKLQGLSLVPGMPAKVYVITHSRKLASLLLKPFQD